MFESQTIQLLYQALWLVLLLSAPPVIVAALVGLLVALVQAATQIQEQTVAFVPKLLAMIVVLGLSLPWVLSRLIEYSEHLISNIPNTL